jgi:hypothetical protein
VLARGREGEGEAAGGLLGRGDDGPAGCNGPWNFVGWELMVGPRGGKKRKVKGGLLGLEGGCEGLVLFCFFSFFFSTHNNQKQIQQYKSNTHTFILFNL